MNLAVNPPVLPVLAKRVGELPPGEGWIFEPKWDGFRTYDQLESLRHTSCRRFSRPGTDAAIQVTLTSSAA